MKCHFASIMLNVKLMNAILLNVMASFGTADNFDFFCKKCRFEEENVNVSLTSKKLECLILTMPSTQLYLIPVTKVEQFQGPVS